MLLLKILGGIDLFAALNFMLLIFGFDVLLQFTLFSAGLLFVKGLFIFTGDPLSAVDLVSALLLVLSIFFGLPGILLWGAAFLLIAKGLVSFI